MFGSYCFVFLLAHTAPHNFTAVLCLWFGLHWTLDTLFWKNKLNSFRISAVSFFCFFKYLVTFGIPTMPQIMPSDARSLFLSRRTQNLWTHRSRVPSRPSSHPLRPRRPLSSASCFAPLRNVTTVMRCSACWTSSSLPNTCWRASNRRHVWVSRQNVGGVS